MNPETGDDTIIDGVKRGHFRLHPMGPLRLSEGCITVYDIQTFDRLAAYIRAQGPTIPVPNKSMKAHGTVKGR